MVLGLSLLLGDAFSGDQAPTSDSVTEPVSNSRPVPVPKEPEQPKVETDFTSDVHLRGKSARVSEITDTNGDKMQGIEYQVEIQLPRRLTESATMNRMEIRAELSGQTMKYLGTDQLHANSFEMRESGPVYSLYLVRLIGFYSNTYETDMLEILATRTAADVRVSLYVDGSKVLTFY